MDEKIYEDDLEDRITNAMYPLQHQYLDALAISLQTNKLAFIKRLENKKQYIKDTLKEYFHSTLWKTYTNNAIPKTADAIEGLLYIYEDDIKKYTHIKEENPKERLKQYIDIKCRKLFSVWLMEQVDIVESYHQQVNSLYITNPSLFGAQDTDS
jgi:hypothetical protein